MASNSSRSISTAPEGRDTPSRRYLSAPQSNSTKSMDRLAGLVAAWSTFTACGVTSAPMPSPGITAMRAAGPPFRKGMPGKVSPPKPFLIQWAGLLFHQSAPRTTTTKFLVPATVYTRGVGGLLASPVAIRNMRPWQTRAEANEPMDLHDIFLAANPALARLGQPS